MRKTTAVVFALLLTTSAFAAPRSESGSGPDALTRIIRKIQKIIRIVHPSSDGQPIGPIPS